MEVNKDMAYVIVADIEGAKKAEGLAAAQERYRGWFFVNPFFRTLYKSTVDNILTLGGNADCIVTE